MPIDIHAPRLKVLMNVLNYWYLDHRDSIFQPFDEDYYPYEEGDHRRGEFDGICVEKHVLNGLKRLYIEQVTANRTKALDLRQTSNLQVLDVYGFSDTPTVMGLEKMEYLETFTEERNSPWKQKFDEGDCCRHYVDAGRYDVEFFETAL